MTTVCPAVDLIADVPFGDLRPHIGNCDMRFVLMGWLRKVHDGPSALMGCMQRRARNRGDDDGNLPGRRRRKGRGSAESNTTRLQRHQQGLYGEDVVPLNAIAKCDVGRPNVPPASVQVFGGNSIRSVGEHNCCRTGLGYDRLKQCQMGMLYLLRCPACSIWLDSSNDGPQSASSRNPVNQFASPIVAVASRTDD
jgi:hypothetical protein